MLVKLENICINCFGELKPEYNSKRFCSNHCSNRYNSKKYQKENAIFLNEQRRIKDGAKKRHIPKIFESTKKSQQTAFNDMPKGGRSLFDKFASAVRFVSESDRVQYGLIEDLLILDRRNNG